MPTYVEVHWEGPDAAPVEVIPIEQLDLLVWRDQFGTVHATGNRALENDGEFDEAVRDVLVTLELNPIIESSKDELDG